MAKTIKNKSTIDITIKPNEIVKIPTGIKVCINEKY